MKSLHMHQWPGPSTHAKTTFRARLQKVNITATFLDPETHEPSLVNIADEKGAAQSIKDSG
jgi:hypothetical protein